MIDILAQTDVSDAPRFLQFLLKGGVFMVPLGIASVVGLAAIVFKSLSLTRERVVPDGLARELASLDGALEGNRAESIVRQFQGGNSSLARLGAVVLKNRQRSRDEINHAVEAAAREESVRMHAGIGVLDVVITVAPLLGLLGTASGLVVIFQGLGDDNNHFAIAKGIAEALNTTIFGLAIAVPCVVAHGYFVRRIERLTARMEILLSDLIHLSRPGNPNA